MANIRELVAKQHAYNSNSNVGAAKNREHFQTITSTQQARLPNKSNENIEDDE